MILVGNAGSEHIGSHLNKAAEELGVTAKFFDTSEAFSAFPLIMRLNWWLRGHRPTRLVEFSREILRACRALQPKWILSTGIAPIEASVLTEIGKLGILRLNYLTDDPWNAAHRASWFDQSLPCYDQVFSVRKSNIADLKTQGRFHISYLPFAYAAGLHYPESFVTEDERAYFACDVVFVGGADRDRLPYIKALLETGLRIGLYGNYWERFSETKAYTRGLVQADKLRKAIGGAKVALCLVRRANRDGNSMRTFEIPAIGSCMLTEDTGEHREIFGKEGEAVVYFRSIPEMLKKLYWLLDHDEERQRLAKRVHQLITEGHHTYKDRLIRMLQQQ